MWTFYPTGSIRSGKEMHCKCPYFLMQSCYRNWITFIIIQWKRDCAVCLRSMGFHRPGFTLRISWNSTFLTTMMNRTCWWQHQQGRKQHQTGRELQARWFKASYPTPTHHVIGSVYLHFYLLKALFSQMLSWKHTPKANKLYFRNIEDRIVC